MQDDDGGAGVVIFHFDIHAADGGDQASIPMQDQAWPQSNLDLDGGLGRKIPGMKIGRAHTTILIIMFLNKEMMAILSMLLTGQLGYDRG